MLDQFIFISSFYLNVVEVTAALEPEHRVDRQLGEVILLHVQQLAGQRGAGDVQQILLELS